MCRVLVTRPAPGASATAQALRDAGWQPVLLPLTGTAALPGADAVLPQADAVAVTSANALHHAPAPLLARIGAVPLFAVGAATADAARRAGFATVVTGPGDAAGLAATLVARLPAGATVLYLCGKVRRPEIERSLRDGGLAVVPIETYDTVRRSIADAEAATLGPLSAVLVHSGEAARALADLARRPAFAPLFAQARLVAISARAAAPLAADFGGRTTLSREPTDAAMIDALGRPG